MRTEYVLFAWQHQTVILLDCVGGCVEEMRSSKDLAEILMSSDVQWGDEQGVYLAEVRPFTITYPAGDCDVGLRGDARLATAAELQAFVDDRCWHDALDNEPETTVSISAHVAEPEPGKTTEVSYVGYDRRERKLGPVTRILYGEESGPILQHEGLIPSRST